MKYIKTFPRLLQHQIRGQCITLLEKFDHVVQGSSPQMLQRNAQLGVIEAPKDAGGGRGNEKTYDPDVAAELFANNEIQRETRWRVDQIRDIRALGRVLESERPETPEHGLEIFRKLSAMFSRKPSLALAAAFWVRYKWQALRALYGEKISARKAELLKMKRDPEALAELSEIQRDENLYEFFTSDDLVGFVSSLLTNIVDNVKVDKNWTVRIERGPVSALQKFATAGAEPAPGTMAAKPRE